MNSAKDQDGRPFATMGLAIFNEPRQQTHNLDHAHTTSGPGVVDMAHMNTSMVGSGKSVAYLHRSSTSFGAKSNLIHHDEDMQTIVSNNEPSHGNKGVSMN
ncbi:unnamed protein product [Lupinus luteus]|uniref:Uncharacterized protein n=1 Tax=Lupinus luteus TaxID=3873 RepID=A0AAV1YFI6_LUPLU